MRGSGPLRRRRATIASRAAFGLALLASIPAQAGGLYFSDRGVRPLSRGGAFVAGADDIGAAWYNPAGLADAGGTLLVDASWLHYRSEFTRRTQVTDGQGVVRVYEDATVKGSTPLLPLPTIGGAFSFGPRQAWTIAATVSAPYAAVTSYPLTVNGQPAASRYLLVSLDGSLLAVPAVFAAYKPAEWLRVGLGLGAMTGRFKATTVFSSSPADRLISAPEDPAYDTFAELDVGPIFAPGLNAGVTLVPHEAVRFAVAGSTPIWVDAPAQVRNRLPTASPFDNARVEGSDARVKFALPAILRAGVEVRGKIGDSSLLRAEFAVWREFWSAHDTIEIVPENIRFYDVTGFPSPYSVPPIRLPREFRDSNSAHLGGEYTFQLGGYTLDARAGLAYEEGAVPNAYLSPLTIDLDKVTTSVGGSIHIGRHWRFDAVYAHVFTSRAEVDPAEARVPRVNPVRGNPTDTEAVNGGSYAVNADILGVGLQYRF